MKRWMYEFDHSRPVGASVRKISDIVFFFFFFVFFYRARQHICPGCTAAVGLLCDPKHYIQYRFSSSVAPCLLWRGRGSLLRLWWYPLAGQTDTQRHCSADKPVPRSHKRYAVLSAFFLQNLQVGSPSNRPMVHRCFVTGACPVRIATTILSWCLLKLSRSSALFLHGLPINSLPCDIVFIHYE
jgi:hypothetical protein